MATFRCKRSGNLVHFDLEHDIAGLRRHEGYEEVLNETNANETIEVKEAAPQEVLKKRGRPRAIPLN